MTPCVDLIPLLGPHADGELPRDDRAFVDDHLAGCPGCRERAALLVAVGAGLRGELAARAAALPLDGFSDAVLARVARDRAPARWTRARVWGNEVFGAHRRVFAAGAGFAVAASLALVVGFAPERAPAAVARPGDEPAVEAVDFGSHDGAVLELPDRTPVIWLSDDHGGSGR